MQSLIIIGSPEISEFLLAHHETSDPVRELEMLTGDHVRTIGSAVTIVAGATGIIFFLAKLDGRVAQLEEKVHTLTLSPVLPSTAQGKDDIVHQPVTNPVAQACADLAKRSADEISKGSWLNSDQIHKTMVEIGCTRSP